MERTSKSSVVVPVAAKVSEMANVSTVNATDGNRRRASFHDRWLSRHSPSSLLHRGTFVTTVMFAIMVVGWILVRVLDMVEAEWILVFGLFGFASGVTNLLAIEMLFEKVPWIAGSGVIPNRFKEIREVIKETVLHVFFDELESSMNFYTSKAN